MIIGVSQRITYLKQRPYDCLEHSYYSFLGKSIIFPIPNKINVEAKQIAEMIDVLLLTGGDDSSLRRTTEIKIATQMLQYKKPIIGICHGSFLLADLLGSKVEQCDGHMDTEHEIFTHDGKTHTVNSFHSQTITSLHKTGRVLATDKEGNIEAWQDGDNIFGITWHPQRGKSTFLFDNLVDILNV
jgi:gamma-glutamyl-gamma-aminobutyrate hydrolase PuuD